MIVVTGPGRCGKTMVANALRTQLKHVVEVRGGDDITSYHNVNLVIFIDGENHEWYDGAVSHLSSLYRVVRFRNSLDALNVINSRAKF
jgi:hypothetical protein